MAATPSVIRTADETDQSIQDAPKTVRLLIQSYEPTRRSTTEGRGKPYVRAHVRGTEGFQKTRGASRDADGTARWFEAQELELDISTGRIVKLSFVDEAGRSTEGEIALGPLLQEFVQSPCGVVRRCVTCVDPLDELEALADNEDVRYASSSGVLRFGVVFLTDDKPQAPPPPRVKARVRIRFEAGDAVVKAALCASGKVVECSLTEARTVVLRSSHAEIDVLCISTSEGSLRVPLGLLPDGKYPTETWSVGSDVQLSLRVERASEERPATPASPGVPVEQKPKPTQRRVIATAAKRIERTVPIRCSLVGVQEDHELVDCDRWRLIATIDGKGPRRVDGASLVFDAKRHSFLDVALGRTTTHSSFVGDGSTQIHAPAISLDALVQIGGECVVWLPLMESHAELGLKPQIGVRIRVNGPRSFKRRPFRGWVHCVAICQQGPVSLALEGSTEEMPPWPDAENGVVLPLRVANSSDAATVSLEVSLGDAVGSLPLTTSILDGGDVASATLDLLRDEECVSTARVTVQALPGETLLSRKLATQEQTQVDPRRLSVKVKGARFLEHPRCRGRIEAYVKLALLCGDDETQARGSVATRGTDTHPQWDEDVLLSLPRALSLLLDAPDLRNMEPPSLTLTVVASTMPSHDDNIGHASLRVPWPTFTSSEEQATLELRDQAGAFRGEVDVCITMATEKTSTPSMLFLATSCKAPLSLESSGRTCASTNALWPLTGRDDDALVVERIDGAGLADLSDLALRALAHPGTVETCEDTLGRGHQASHVQCEACVLRPATGSLEVVVEALDLDEQACERAARLTDGEADAPSLPSRTFCRVSVKGSLGHGAHTRSTTSLVGKAAFGGPHAEKLSLEIDASRLIDPLFVAPSLEIAVLDERGGWRNRVAKGSVALAPLIALSTERSKETRGLVLALEDPVTGAQRGSCTLSCAFKAVAIASVGAPTPSQCASAALLKKVFFDCDGGPSHPVPRSVLLASLDSNDAPWASILDLVQATSEVTWDVWRDVVSTVSTRADLLAAIATSSQKRTVKRKRGGGPGVVFSLAFSAASQIALKTDAAEKCIVRGAELLLRGVDGRVVSVVGSSCAVSIGRAGFDGDGVKKVLSEVDGEAPLGAAVLRTLGPCTLSNVKIGAGADKIRSTTTQKRAWDPTLTQDSVRDDAKTRAAIAVARDARRALRREKKVLEAVVCAGGGKRAAAALLLAATETVRTPTPKKGRTPRSSIRRTPPSSRRRSHDDALSPSSVWAAHAREGAAMERESLVNEAEALKAQAETSAELADGFRRAAKRAADDLEDARRRDAEAEARLRAAEKARRAASAALERRDAELREVRAKKRADAKREVFRRDYAAKAALRVEEAAKEQDSAARVFQRRARPFLAKKLVEREREEVVERKKAASTLVKRRREVIGQRQEKKAATCVQKTYRGLTARRAVKRPVPVVAAPVPAPTPAPEPKSPSAAQRSAKKPTVVAAPAPAPAPTAPKPVPVKSPPAARPASPDPIVLRENERRAAARRATRAEDILRKRRAELQREAELRAEKAADDRRRRAYLSGASCLYRGVERVVLRRCREFFVSWRRGGRAPTVRRRRTRRKGDDREAYRRAEANRDLEAERSSALERAEIARARADAEEARLRLARREADAADARLRELERRRHEMVRASQRASPPTTPRRDAPARPGLSQLVTRPEPSPEKPAEDDSFPSFHKEPTPRDPTPRRAVAPSPRVEPDPVVPSPRVDEPSVAHLEHTPEPTPRQWPPFGQALIGAHVKINVKGVWLRGEITDVAAAMPELEGGNGVCIHVNDAGEDEWHEYGSDEVRILTDEEIYVHPRPPFGEELVGNFVQVHVAGAWLNAVITEVDADHNGHEEICIQYAQYKSADPEWHLYDSEDIIYRDDPTTPGASHMSRATPENDPESPRVIDATPQRVPAEAPNVISEWKKTDRAWPPFSEDLVGSSVKVLVDGASLAAEIIEVAEAMAELDGLNGVCIRFRDDEHADEEWHEYGTEDILFVREEPVASPGSFFR
ncbi:unnamed protein product [Pelagomonas calceolata]|uniref:C2 domain-containing protein n=1 Tax=Pelagomonas calceolata TaxID=35677 RepID=A0A8J2X6T5_9STRA|nr:unnamed protein product [Pelagomonas calceolata]